MCWQTCNKNNLQKKTAKSDIKVIKILLKTADGAFVSPYIHTEYRIDKVYCSEIGEPIESWGQMWTIYEGLHSYSPSAISFGMNSTLSLMCIRPIKDAVNLLDSWNYMTGAVIFEGVIPNGSKYYENWFGEIVSNKLKVVSVIAEIDSDLVFSSDKIQALNERIHNL